MRELEKREKEAIISALEAYEVDIKHIQKFLGDYQSTTILATVINLKNTFRKFATKIYVEE